MKTTCEDFISDLYYSNSYEDSCKIIKCELADLRTLIKDCDPDFRPNAILKLFYLFLLGENVNFCQLEVINLMNDNRYSYKRVGYMAGAVIISETSEISILLTHTLLKDLQSDDPKVQLLALTYIANMGSNEVCQDAINDVLKLMKSINKNIVKKAIMASVRIVKKIPEMKEYFIEPTKNILRTASLPHGMIMALLNLIENIICNNDELKDNFMCFHSSFVKILRQLNQMKSKEFKFSSYNDPFLQIKVMKMLCILKKPSQDLDDLLESILTSVDIKRNSGRAVLSQVIETIMSTANKPSLKTLAFAQIGKLFKFKEANFLYTGLSKILYSREELGEKTDNDSVAFLRYKSQIVKCLNHKDPSIRRRALNVISALVDESNVTTLIPEVLDYVKLADNEFRFELTSRLFFSVQRYAPNNQWKFDIIMRILIENGNYVGSEIITSICKLLINTPSLRENASQQLLSSIISNNENQSLIQVAAWTIGEFISNENGALEILKNIISMPQTTDQTKGYLIIAICKISVRFSHKNETISFLQGLSNSLSLDIQQRVGEMIRLLSLDGIDVEILASNEQTESESNIIINNETNLTTNQKDELVDDLLDISNINNAPTTKKTDYLRDLIDDLSVKKEIKPFPGSNEVLRKSDFVIYFEIIKNPQNPYQFAIRSSIFNLQNTQLNSFSIKYGVPNGWGIRVQQQSSNVLLPIGDKPIVQQFFLSGNGEPYPMIKTLISYNYGSQQINECGEIPNTIFI